MPNHSWPESASSFARPPSAPTKALKTRRIVEKPNSWAKVAQRRLSSPQCWTASGGQE